MDIRNQRGASRLPICRYQMGTAARSHTGWRLAGASLVTALICCLVGAQVATACDTPVYRYAMYRWAPAPYEVYLFHDGTVDQESEAVKQAVQQHSEREGARANIVFLPVDLSEDQALAGIPPDVQQAWESRSDQSLPAFLISSPVGIHLHEGDLAAAEIGALVDSPLRKKIGQLLEAGKAGVFVLVTGKDEAADVKARETVESVVSDVNSGQVSLYRAPPPMYGGPAGPSAVAAEAAPDSPQMGMIELPRSAAQENWLLKCLLALEPDLVDRTEPIVFTLYGRGRAVFSCLGKGIHRDNLVMDVEFITGACSCTVKEQNPGVDLLMTYDWEAAAAAIAEKFGAEEGSEYQFGGDQLFPELIIPTDDTAGTDQETVDQTAAAGGPEVVQTQPAQSTDAPSASEEATTEDREDAAIKLAEVIAAGQSPAEQLAAQPDAEADIDALPRQLAVTDTVDTRELSGNDSTGDHATSTPVTEVDSKTKWASMRGVVLVGVGLGVAFVVFLGATFIVLRP